MSCKNGKAENINDAEKLFDKMCSNTDAYLSIHDF